MKTPKGNVSISNKCAKWAYSHYNDSLLFKLGIGLVVAVPPALAATLYGNEDLKKLIYDISPTFYQKLANISQNYVLLINLISFLWPIIMMILGIEIVKRASIPLLLP